MAKPAYEMIGRLFPREKMRQLGSILESSGMSYSPEAFAGFVVMLCLLGSVIAYLLALYISPLRGFLFSFSSLIWKGATVSTPLFPLAILVVLSVFISVAIVCLVSYVSLMLMADSRRRRVEEVLPEFLSLSAANVRAGMTIDQAMWYAAKPEFGILSEEVSNVAKKTFGGIPFNQAIDYLPERFNSKAIRRAVALIKQGIASGGKLADILERTAEDSQEMMILRKEISASLVMYIIFIVFAGAIGTPFLFAISGRLIAILENVFSNLPSQPSSYAATGFQASVVTPTKPSISSADFFLFTILCAIMTAVFSSLIIGVISKGSKKEGIPYIPFLVAVSLAIFFLMGMALESFLTSIYI
ncbi:MAG: type II secretion system F family protein [Candidatus Anstonellaceae archaeon]